MALDDFDRALMAATQGGLPLVPRPYDAVGQQLGVSGQQVHITLLLLSRLAGQLPRSVIRARTRPWGVTSKAGLAT